MGNGCSKKQKSYYNNKDRFLIYSKECRLRTRILNYIKNSNRELAEWFIAISLKLVWF